jgi:hypothetical protein
MYAICTQPAPANLLSGRQAAYFRLGQLGGPLGYRKMPDDFEELLKAAAQHLRGENDRAAEAEAARVAAQKAHVAEIQNAIHDWTNRIVPIIDRTVAHANQLMEKSGITVTVVPERSQPREVNPGPPIPGLPALNILHRDQAANLTDVIRRGLGSQAAALQATSNIPRLQLRLTEQCSVVVSHFNYKAPPTSQPPILISDFGEQPVKSLFSEFITAGLVGRRDFGAAASAIAGELQAQEAPDTLDAKIEVIDRPAIAKPEPKTAIGRAVLENAVPIEILAFSFLNAIQEKIDELREKLPNSDEGQDAVKHEIARCEELKRRVEEFLHSSQQFSNNQETETALVTSTTTLANGIANWWHEDHVGICRKTLDISLFSAGVTLCWLAGAGGELAAIIPGVLVGGGKMVEAIKCVQEQR